VWRQGAAKELTAKLGSADEKSAKAEAGKKDAASQGKLGLALRPMQPDEKQEAGVDNGLVVQQATGPAPWPA
jgi:serine protease Do